jgi:hypothetical protein
MAFGGSTSSNTLPHTHNQTLTNDGGDLSETLTDMNGIALYSLITDNATAVAANTANIATNTAAIAAIGGIDTGGVIIWTTGTIPAGWAFYSNVLPIQNVSEQTVNNSWVAFDNQVGGDRTMVGQQFNAGQELIGKSPSQFSWTMYKSGAPTGTVYARITNSSGTVRETSTTTLDPSTLGSSSTGTSIVFPFTGNTTLAAGDMITIEWNDYVPAGGEVRVNIDATTAGTNTVLRQSIGGTLSDLAGKIGTYAVEWNFKYIIKT